MAKKTSSQIEADAKDIILTVLGCTGTNLDPIGAYHSGYDKGYDEGYNDGYKGVVEDVTELEGILGGISDNLPRSPQEIASLKMVKEAVIINDRGFNTKSPKPLTEVHQKVLTVTSVPDITLEKHLKEGWLIKSVSPISLRPSDLGGYFIINIFTLEKVVTLTTGSSSNIGIAHG